MSNEDWKHLAVTALATVIVEGVRVAANYLDRHLARRQDRKAEEQRHTKMNVRDDNDF